jgi:cyclophilin family peptidyl-prolyl cis-trans isomerase
MDTSFGPITLALEQDKAPISVENFLRYVSDGFYDGTLFHRIANNALIQGGGITEDNVTKTTLPPIQNEADNGLRNLRGSIAMARLSDPHTAAAQFFINQVDNPSLDFVSKTNSGWGYAVFGRVIDGLDVVDTIASQRASSSGRPFSNIVINSVSLITESAVPTYDPETALLALPIVASDGVIYAASLLHLGGASFLLTDISEVPQRFAFEDTRFDAETNTLHIAFIDAGDVAYTAELVFSGDNRFVLTQLSLAEQAQ